PRHAGRALPLRLGRALDPAAGADAGPAQPRGAGRAARPLRRRARRARGGASDRDAPGEDVSAPEPLRVVYHLDVDAARAEARAEAVAREQTVEVPRVAVRDPVVLREALGRVERLEEDPEGG